MRGGICFHRLRLVPTFSIVIKLGAISDLAMRCFVQTFKMVSKDTRMDLVKYCKGVINIYAQLVRNKCKDKRLGNAQAFVAGTKTISLVK